MSDADLRPSPEPSPLTAPFWEAASRRVLVRPLCGDCGTSFFTPQIACRNCLSENWSYEPSSGRGVVYSATIVHRAPFPGFDAPFHLAIVDMEEDWSMLTNIVGAGPAPVAIGTNVQVEFMPAQGGFLLPTFTLAEGDER